MGRRRSAPGLDASGVGHSRGKEAVPQLIVSSPTSCAVRRGHAWSLTGPATQSGNSMGLVGVVGAVFMFLSITMDWGMVLGLRFSLAGLPISILDIVFLLLVVVGTWESVLGRFCRNAASPFQVWITILLALWVVVGVVSGLAEGNSSYDVLKDLRVIAYLLVSFWAFALFVPLRGYLDSINSLVIFAGIVVSLQVFYGFFEGYLRSGNAASARDVLIPAQTLPFAFLFLFLRHGWFPKRRKGSVFVCMVLFSAAMLLTLTRGVWLEFVLAVCFYLLFARRRRARLLSGVVIAAVILAVALSYCEGMGWLPGVGREVQYRFESFVNFAHGRPAETWIGRLNELSTGFSKVRERPFQGWGLGTAIHFVDPTLHQTLTESTYFHDSVLYYLVKLGIPGLLMFIAFSVYPIGRLVSVNLRSLYYDEGRIVLSSLAGFMLAGNFSGNLSYPPFMVLLGAMFAQCAALARHGSKSGHGRTHSGLTL